MHDLPESHSYPVAELDRRFYAFALDRLLTWLLVAATGLLAWLLLGGVWPTLAVGGGVLVLVWLVLTVMTGVSGSTAGKSLVGLRVVHEGTGAPIGVAPALLRSLVLGVASLPTFGLGLVTLAWTAVEDRGRQRRGWHDHLAHSVVVDVRPVDDRVVEIDETPRHVVNLTAMRLIPAPPVEVDPPTPSRRASPEQSMRRNLDAPTPTPTPTPTPAAPPPPPAWTPPPPLPPADGRTVVRPKTEAVPGAVAAPSGPRWRVQFDTGESFVVEGMALVGRRPEPRSGEQVHHLVPLSSADMSVSKTHAQFGPAPDGVLVVMDRGSTNGSVLHRQGVSRVLAAGKPTTIVDGDVVSFGDRQMRVSREA